MRVLISGINGYVGSSLANFLISKNIVVAGIVRKKDKKLENLHLDIKIYQSDILNIDTLVIHEKYDFFIHLAGANDVDSKNEKDAILITTLGTKKALEFSENNNIKNFIYFSTFQVYGVDYGNIDEQSNLNCKNDYSLTHYFAEEQVRFFSRNNNIKYLILRPTNIYGAAINSFIDRNSLVPNCFCKDAITNSEIILQSSGKQYRNFISLKEVSESLHSMLLDFTNYENKILNLASDFTLSIHEVSKIVKNVYEEIFKKKCSLQIMNKKPMVVSPLIISIEALPKISFSSRNMEIEIRKIFKLMSTNEIT